MSTTLRKAPTAYTPLVVRELTALEADLGGRRELVGLLTLAPLTDDLRYVLGLLGDPRHDRLTLAEICARGNLLPGQLIKHLGEAALLRGRTLAMQKIGQHLANVAEDVMRRAAPYEDSCTGPCRGTGSVVPEPTSEQPNPEPVPCEVCLGTGRLIFKPELDRQKLAIEMGQLLPKGAGVNIALQQNVHTGSSAGMGALEKLQLLTDRILYGQEVVEGKIIDEEGSAPMTTPEPSMP